MGGRGIALNAVAPGVIATPMTAYLRENEELRAAAAERLPQPLGETGAPEHVASLLVWLTSEANGFTTGQVIFVDGGYDAVIRGEQAF
jgi:NAD(P)-dependent dehydrogenase (short-subunit alcohol dehydrogenase family)